MARFSCPERPNLNSAGRFGVIKNIPGAWGSASLDEGLRPAREVGFEEETGKQIGVKARDITPCSLARQAMTRDLETREELLHDSGSKPREVAKNYA